MQTAFIIKLKRRIAWKRFSNFESVFHGNGLEIDDFRTYVRGDTPKSINRKLSAKMNKLFVNTFQEDKSVDLDVFLDINYNRKGTTQYGNNAQLVLDLLGDILIYSKKYLVNLHIFIPEYIQQANSYNLIDAYSLLDRFPHILTHISKKYQSGLDTFLIHAKNKRKTRAFVIISDFLDVDSKQKNIFEQLRKDHALYLFRIPIHPYFGQNYEHTIHFPLLKNCQILKY